MSNPTPDPTSIPNWMPDPAWGYYLLWEQLDLLEKRTKELREYMAQQETATPESDRTLQEHYFSMQRVCDFAIALLEATALPESLNEEDDDLQLYSRP